MARNNNKKQRSRARAGPLRGGLGGESIAHVKGQYAHAFATIVSGSPQLVFQPTNVSSGALGGRLQDFTNLYDRMRFRSLKVTALAGPNATPLPTEMFCAGFVAGGIGNTTAPNVVSIEQMSQLSRFVLAHYGQTVPVSLRLSASELNPSTGWFDVDGGFQWYLYVGAYDINGALVVSDVMLLFEYDMEFTGAVDPAVFQKRCAERSAQAPVSDETEGYIQVGGGAVVATKATAPSQATRLPTLAALPRR
jgi:hypothetical protein